MVDWGSIIWAADDRTLRGILAQVEQVRAALSVELPEPLERSILTMQPDGTAEIAITGLLLRQRDEMLAFWGVENTGYDEIVRAIDVAKAQGARGILLSISSPGGDAQGVGVAADAIYNARANLPVVAHISGIGASGAYWLASQATEISADRDAIVGSIGVFSVMRDFSEMLEGAGIKTHVLRFGEYKGAGVVGAEITEGQLSVQQDYVNSLGAQFVEAIARGRGAVLSNPAAVATGAYWITGEAIKRNLVDAEGEGKTARGRLSARIEGKSQMEKELQELKAQMAEMKTAHAAELEQARADARADALAELQAMSAAMPVDFAVAQFTAGADLVTARLAHAELVIAENAELKARLAKAEEMPPEDEEEGEGEEEEEEDEEQAAVNQTPVSAASADFLSAVDAYRAKHDCGYAAAASAVAKAQPELYRAHVRR